MGKLLTSAVGIPEQNRVSKSFGARETDRVTQEAQTQNSLSFAVVPLYLILGTTFA